MAILDAFKKLVRLVDRRRELDHPFCSVIVPAAGSARRMNGIDKLFEELGGIPVLVRTLKTLNDCPYVDEIIIPARVDDIGRIAAMMTSYSLNKISHIIPGGETRGDSVRTALAECSKEAELIAVHDAARPLATAELIERAVRCGAKTRACVVCVPVKDTIKQVSGEIVAQTLPRETLYAAQTPQVFDSALLKAAYEKALQDEIQYTDDSSAVEALGKHVTICEGEYTNIKLTDPSDFITAERILEERNEF